MNLEQYDNSDHPVEFLDALEDEGVSKFLIESAFKECVPVLRDYINESSSNREERELYNRVCFEVGGIFRHDFAEVHLPKDASRYALYRDIYGFDFLEKGAQRTLFGIYVDWLDRRNQVTILDCLCAIIRRWIPWIALHPQATWKDYLFEAFPEYALQDVKFVEEHEHSQGIQHQIEQVSRELLAKGTWQEGLYALKGLVGR